MRLQENNLIMEQYALIHEKKKLPKGFVPFKKGHGKKDSKGKKKNPFASMKKESADIYATMSEAPMTADDQQLQQDAGINQEQSVPAPGAPSPEDQDLIRAAAQSVGIEPESLWQFYQQYGKGQPLADFLSKQNDDNAFDHGQTVDDSL